MWKLSHPFLRAQIVFLTKHDRTGSYPSYLSAQSEFLASTTSTPGHHEVQPVPTRAPFVYTQLLCWLKWVCCLHGLASMPSAQEIAKRALVQLVRTQGSQYGVDVAVTRESPCEISSLNYLTDCTAREVIQVN